MKRTLEKLVPVTRLGKFFGNEDFDLDIEDFNGSLAEEEQDDLRDEATTSKITFEFDPEMCASILRRIEEFRKSEELKTKEQVLLRMFELCGI